jgi:hypothetical protein
MQRQELLWCQSKKSTMKKTGILLFAVLAFASCRKSADATTDNAARVSTNLQITSTQTPATASQGETIISRVKSYGPNLCYKFDRMDVQTTATREYAIRSLGTVPSGDPVCAQALMQVDTTISIPTATSGTYILRFYNGTQLFKADTVQVN